MAVQGTAAGAGPAVTRAPKQRCRAGLAGTARQRAGSGPARRGQGQRLILKLPLAVRRERNFSRAGFRMNQAASAAAMFSAEAM